MKASFVFLSTLLSTATLISAGSSHDDSALFIRRAEHNYQVSHRRSTGGDETLAGKRSKRSSSSSSSLSKHERRQKRRRERRAALEAARLLSSKAARSSLTGGTTTTQPSNIADGTATADEGCTKWHTVLPGEVCLGVIDKTEGLTVQDFYHLNPDVNSDCGNLRTGLAYCIDTDHQTPSPQISTKPKSLTKTCKKKTTTSSSKSVDTVPDDNSSDVVPVSAGTSKTSNNSTTSSSSSSSKGQTDSEGFRISGLISIATSAYSSSCGSPDAQADSDETTGPNGSIDWLNCGISKSDPSGQWNAPDVKISDLVVKDLTADGVFAPCAQYFDLFHAAAKKYDVPAIFFASFAMQESTCNADAVGDNGGAWGLMQITTDKCGGAPGGNCKDPAYNVDTGAAYFRKVLDQLNGNVLHAMGQYNGWPTNMSYQSATAAGSSSCCVCQNNLDYLHQMLNGWAQGKDAGQMKPYNNLAICGGSQAGNSKRSVAGSRLMARYFNDNA